MLIAALGLVLVGFAFLVVSLVTENSVWAWGCILACVAAAVVLVVETRGRRARGAAPVATATATTGPATEDERTTELITVPGAREEQPTTVLPVVPGSVTPSAPPPAAETFVPLSGTSLPEHAPVAVAPVAVAPVALEPAPTAAPAAAESEPAEEDADASDVLVVAGLEQAVVVVDEHPRFHVANCSWLAGRATMSLAAREAVELGFTPCSRCAPARTLASLTRA